jgi:N-acetylmuramoyl-L-alanine amidase
MADPTGFHFVLPETGRPEPFRLAEERVPNYQWYDQHRATSRIYHPINGIEAVVVHATAGFATQHALDAWLTSQASAHWIVPDEDEPQHGRFVWAGNSATHPDLGNKLRVNHWSVGIEIVNTQDVQDYSDPYSSWQVSATALIVRYCWAKYPNLKHVISHAKIDPTRRADPGRNFPWSDFKALVLSDANDPAVPRLARSIPPASDYPAVPAGGCSM